MAANVHIAELLSRFNLTPERVASLARSAGQAAVVVGVAYLVASFVSSYTMSGLMTSAMAAYKQRSGQKVATSTLNLSTTDNYRDIEKAVRDRNLFNSAGEFPDEKSSEQNKGRRQDGRL